MQRGETLSGRGLSKIIVCAVSFVALVGLTMVMQRGWHTSAAVGHAANLGAEDFWEVTGEMVSQLTGADKAVPAQARVWRLNEDALRRSLKRDKETVGGGDGATDGTGSGAIISLPMPDGKVERFRVVESPVMRAELAAQHPEIKSYRGWGVDNPALTMRCDLSPLGFHAAMTDGAELMAIHPISNDDKEHYVSYAGKDYASAAEEARCLVNDAKIIHRITPEHSINSSVGTSLRTYDIAIATTQEYANSLDYGHGNQSLVISNLASWFNGINTIYERELSIHLNVVTNNNLIFAGSDPFTNGDVNLMADEVRAVFKTYLTPGSYDLGLVLGTPVGTPASYGSAYIGVVCETSVDANGNPYKGGGAALMTGSLGNTGGVTLLAHEIGHQFGATHTYNAACGGGRVGDSAYESGSGLTLMSNAGGCGSDNIATARSANFHAGSFEQIIGYLNVLGGSCATLSANANHPPIVDGGLDYVIPKQTPFTLTATGNDADSDVLSYSWEQVDAGGTSFMNPPYSDSGDPAQTTRPIFRPFDPVSNPSRTFPSLSDILSNRNDGQFEKLPQVARAMNFRVTARDGHSGSSGGGVSNDSVRLDVDGNSGPFTVTEPYTAGTTWTGGATVNVKWSVNNTNAAPINCTQVLLKLSIDGGITFNYPLNVVNTASNVASNTGSASVIVPNNISTAHARVKVEAVGNIFFDISDAEFTIQPVACINAINSTEQFFSTNGGNGTVQVTAGCSWAVGNVPSWITINSGGSGSGNGTVSYTVSANPNTTRRSTMAIAGQPFTVTQAGTASVNGLMFYPLDRPVRLLDTRAGAGNCDNVGTPITGGTSITTLARTTCEGLTIPATAQAITGNVTVINQTPQTGYITLYPDGQLAPTAVNMLYGPNDILANNFTVGLSAAGNFAIFAERNLDAVVDISGYYAPPGAGGLYYHPLPNPIRLLDTRANEGNCDNVNAPILAGNSITTQARVTCEGMTIPPAAQAIVGTATVINGSGQTGYLTIYPNGVAAPVAANMIYFPDQILSNAFTTSLNTNGEFNIFGERTINIVTDIAGYYSAEATDANGPGLLFTPLSRPLRTLDTRAGQGNCDSVTVPITSGSSIATAGRLTCEGLTIPVSAQSILGNVTVINQTGSAGYLTLYPDGVAKPLTANMIYQPSQLLTTAFVVGLNPSTGQYRIFAERTLHAIVDVAGYFAP